MESCRKSAVEIFCKNSHRIKTVLCFRKGAASLMFDGVQNATLSEENVSTTVVTQGNLELPLPLNSLDLHEKMKKMNQMKFWTGPTSSFPNIFETMDSMLIGL